MSRSTLPSTFVLSLFCFLLSGGASLLPAQEESVNQGNITTSVGVNWTTAYFFRGTLQEDNGVIVQPSAEVGATLHEGETSSLSANAGVWYSLHSEGTGDNSSADGRSAAYEEDVYAGLNYSYDKFSFGGTYVMFTSPNDAFATIEELDLSVSYDDSEALGTYALSPYIMVGIETDNHSGADEATYVEVGVSPGTKFRKDQEDPISINFPLTIGLSGDDYYTDPSGDEETLGYVQFGPHASMPLATNTKWGSLSLSAGVDYLWLAGDGVEATNNGDSSEVLGNISLNLTY